MEDSDTLVDLTAQTNVPSENVRFRKNERSVVDLTTEDEIEIIEPPNKKQKQDEPIDIPTVEVKEKRLAAYRPNASKIMQEKMQKSCHLKIYLIQKKPHSQDSLEREYVVFGTNGNVYTVKIGKLPSCDCEDNKNGANRNHCDHILFVFLKVLQVSQGDPKIWQKALVTSELRTLFTCCPPISPSLLADPAVVEKYLEIMRAARSKKVKHTVPQKEVEGNCPICFEKMTQTQELVYCKYSCGNSIHQGCFEQLKKIREDEGQDVKCTYCRAKWDQDWESVRNAHMKNGYLNLAEYQDQSLHLSPTYLMILPEILRMANRFPPWMFESDDEDDEDYTL